MLGHIGHLSRRGCRAKTAIVVTLIIAMFVLATGLDQTGLGLAGGSGSPSDPGAGGRPGYPPVSCPWLASAINKHPGASSLAALVVSRMNLSEKIGEIVLRSDGRYENVNSGVPGLCIPRLTLQDGPQGLAYGDTGVTQLPAPLALAATFDTTLARSYGLVQGQEARTQGIDVVQGPNLNIDRVPESGRTYEGFGEDPLLASEMGVNDIHAIQSQGVIAQAKHLVAYNQEDDRGLVDAQVPARALEELYLKPFRAAVKQGHVASIMCAYPRLDGVFQCQDPALISKLGQWGFRGFVRSDSGAVHDVVAAIEAGTDLIKPADPAEIASDVHTGLLSVSFVNAAVTRILTTMFAWNLVGRQAGGGLGTPAATPAHAATALRVAERSQVLLKDSGAVLPFSSARMHSLAVIGEDASTQTITTGFGSSQVVAPFTSTPLAAIKHRAGPGVRVKWSGGGSYAGAVPLIPSSVLTPGSGQGRGLSFAFSEPAAPGGGRGAGPISVHEVVTEPSVFMRLAGARTSRPGCPAGQKAPPGHVLSGSGTCRIRNEPTAQPPAEKARSGRRAGRHGQPSRRALPGAQLVMPYGMAAAAATMSGTVTPPASGLYVISLSGEGGATSLTLDGTVVLSNPYDHGPETWSAAIPLKGGHRYRLLLRWSPFTATLAGKSIRSGFTGIRLGWENATPLIANAVRAAASSQATIVFAGSASGEGADRPNLALPGDENALISAVAAVNPRTVVVLNTGGAVTMPWLNQVAAVVEAWYPGEQDGHAIAALLFGDVNPSGHLPVTFPVSGSQAAVDTVAQWPGVNLVADYSEGLDVGYRYFNARGISPLFPFGFGLSYTAFSMTRLHATASSGGGYQVTLTVTNSGMRAGIACPQLYLTFPAQAGEPPGQLVAFKTADIPAGRSVTIALQVPAQSFSIYRNGAWIQVPGQYQIAAGFSSASTPLRVTVDGP